jgi:TetR/AcrR family transcriptional regulator
MPKAFSEPEKEWIQQQLVDQGYRLFSAYGLKKTSVEELAEAAGISKGAFYGFYDSKEALFMDVIEQVETRFREEILAEVEAPGPTPRLRLYTVLKKAFAILKTEPLLQFLSSSDFDMLQRRALSDQFEQHLASDRVFIEALVERCQAAGIPITAPLEQISGLFYAQVLAILHEDELGPDLLTGILDIQLELVAAYCLGEIELQGAQIAGSLPAGRRVNQSRQS